MKTLLAAIGLMLATGTAAQAFEAGTQDVISRHKANKLVSIADIATLMRESEQWCYINEDHTCSWTDIYLDVTDAGATFEIGNAWDADTNIAFTDRGTFRDNRYICETGEDWVPTVRATRRSDGSAIYGRQLWEIKGAIQANQTTESIDCFDYLYLSSEPGQQVVTLLQRQYTDDVHVEGNDVEVTLHMSAEDAAGLQWRW